MSSSRLQLSTKYLNLNDFEASAKRLLPKALYTYMANAAGDEQALNANRESFSKWAFIPHQLRGVQNLHTRSRLFGHEYSLPIGVSAFGAAAVLGYNADIQMAKAAYHNNIPYQLSANSITPMEEVIKVNPEAWFTAYLPDDAAVITPVIERVKKAGFKTLAITVDVPISAFREAETRAGYAMPFKPSFKLILDMFLHPRWVISRFAKTLIKRGVPHIENILPTQGPSIFARNVGAVGGSASFDWDNIRAIRAQWQGTLLLKGILAPEDARHAEKIGVDGVIVSNHGARLSETAISPLEALPAIRSACPSLPLLMDGGVRRAGDALKAMALGADGVVIGRPFFYSVIVAGEQGLSHAIQLISAEMKREMGFLGLLNLQEVRESNRLHRR